MTYNGTGGLVGEGVAGEELVEEVVADSLTDDEFVGERVEEWVNNELLEEELSGDGVGGAIVRQLVCILFSLLW